MNQRLQDRLGCVRSAAAALVVVLGLGSAALADPPTPGEVIREVQKSYRSAPSCERVQVEIRYPAPAPAPGMRVARSSILVRIQPGAIAASAAPPATEETKPASDSKPPEQAVAALSLDLGPIRIWAADGRLIAAHDRDPSTYYLATLGAPISSVVLGEVLPPILLPALDLATAAPETACSQFWPYATEIVWQSVEADAKQPGRRTIKGICTGGTVALVAQGQRLRSLTIDQPGKKTTLTLSFSAFLPCDPAKTAIDVANRERVESMGDLRPRSGTLRVGVRVPQMPLSQAAGAPWDLGSLLQAPMAAAMEGVKPAEHVVLVFLRQQAALSTSGGGAGVRRFDADQLSLLLKQMRAEAFKPRPPLPGDQDRLPGAAIARFGFAPVLVLNAPGADEILKRLKETGEKWGQDVLWTTEAKSTIDLFAPGAEAVCVILDADFVLRAVIPVDAAQTAEQVADQVAAALFELAPGDVGGK